MEYFDLYDRNRIPLGSSIPRGEPIPEGTFHLVIHLCIFNPEGKLLIQKRRAGKTSFPGVWDISMGGSSISGETSLEALKRETLEELGYRIEGDPLPFLTVFYSEGFDDYYCIKADIDETKLTLQEEEVDRIRWADRDEVMSLIDSAMFIPYRKDLISLLWDAGTGDGAFSRIGPQFGIRKAGKDGQE